MLEALPPIRFFNIEQGAVALDTFGRIEHERQAWQGE